MKRATAKAEDAGTVAAAVDAVAGTGATRASGQRFGGSLARPQAESSARLFLRRALEVHLTRLGYSSARTAPRAAVGPEIVRRNPVRGRTVYGETILHEDLHRPDCHERLLRFSQRRTRHRSSILFFIAVADKDEPELHALLEQLEIRNGTRGGHVHVVPVAAPSAVPRRGRAAGGRR